MTIARFQADLQDREILDAIDRVLAVLQQPAQMMADIGERIEANANLRFETKTDPSGQPWAPLRPATVEIYTSDWFKERNRPHFDHGIPGSLLERTGQLRYSLAYNPGVDYVEIGTSRQVGKKQWQVGWLHEWGTRKMVPRRILTADPETGELGAGDAADVLDIVSAALDAALG